MNDELKSLVESAVCEELARAKQLNEDYDAVLRSLASYLGAGGYNDPSPLIDPKVAEAKIRWGIDTQYRLKFGG